MDNSAFNLNPCFLSLRHYNMVWYIKKGSVELLYFLEGERLYRAKGE